MQAVMQRGARSVQVKALFSGSGPKKSTQVLKKSGTTGTRVGGVGYKKFEDNDTLWLPNTTRPAWLDGTLPGDNGFDPLGLAKPSDFVQISLDGEDQNAAVNQKGKPVGSAASAIDEVSQTTLAPYSEVFGLQRFRECELIHGRWAMLACLGAIVAEAITGVSWAEAGKVELDGSVYAGFQLPFTITQLVWIEVLAVGGAEFYRSSETNPERRQYPGGLFDPLGLASGDPAKAFKLKENEIAHSRLAMVAFAGYWVQALSTGEGALGSLAKFTDSL